MMRKPNRNAPKKIVGITSAEVTIQFTQEEFNTLKFNTPGPSGMLGGYQGQENFIIVNTDKNTFRCKLPAIRFERTVRYCSNKYGSGGPNARIRKACIPALRRMGIVIEE